MYKYTTLGTHTPQICIGVAVASDVWGTADSMNDVESLHSLLMVMTYLPSVPMVFIVDMSRPGGRRNASEYVPSVLLRNVSRMSV